VGSSLYRLPAFCHAESLIPAVRFLRKEKSSILRAGYSLRRTEISAQTLLDAETSCPPCIPLLTKRRGRARSEADGGGIPSVAQILSLQKVPSVTEHARNFLRRSLCAAYGAEFFLYEKMGRRAIVPAGSTSEAGGRAQAPVPTPHPQKDGNPRGHVPDAPLAAHLRIR
jgi:hypothetical protein